jgi:5-methylcytosine-specific restriction endonuclease McrA
MKNGKRDYTRDYAWQKKTGKLKDIYARVKARREVIKKVGKAAVRGKDIDHRVPLSKGGSNTMDNFRIASRSANRSFSRNADGSLKSQTSKRERKR